MDILGAVVLIDPSTDLPYAASHGDDSAAPDTWGPGIMGGLVLIDPDTKEPYRLGA
jgi:hypothetical protein